MATNKSGPLPITVTFQATDSTLSTHTWDFGDGTPTGTGSQVTHTYTAYGTYNVTHNGVNTCGSSCNPVTEQLVLTTKPIPIGFQLPIDPVYGVLAISILGMVWLSRSDYGFLKFK